MTGQSSDQAYADKVECSARIAELVKSAPTAELKSLLRVPGRILSWERLGSGQVHGILGDAEHQLRFHGTESLFESVDALDLVVMEASAVRRGSELVLEVEQVHMLTPSSAQGKTVKSLDTLTLNKRRAQPELDMILQTDRGLRLGKRPKLMQATRHFLDGLGFLEVDTPFLVPWPDIAPVAPVAVSAGQHVNPGDLRIANTEFMRRLLVSGFDRIYQLGRCFRDESPSWKHEIEFTQLTFGMAYANYTQLMGLIEDLTLHLLESVGCSENVSFQGHRISFERPWRRVTVREAVQETTGVDVLDCNSNSGLADAVKSAGLKVPDVSADYGGVLSQARMLDAIIDEHVIPTFDRPTWLCEYPLYLGGPAKEILGRPEVKMRSELFVTGMELANISVPQNDPTKVRAWYEEMLRLKSEKGWDSPYLDEPYLKSMELGIPVATTGGLGYDRLLMVLLDAADVRDVLLFPAGSQYGPSRGETA